MHTVIETFVYLRAAKAAGMTAEEMLSAVNTVASNPSSGVLIPGTRGFRKLRLAGRGFGKSGGYRLNTYFLEEGLPVVLMKVFSKGDQSNLQKAERNALAASEPQIRADLEKLR